MQALKRLQGAFALAVMFKGDDDLIVGARNGPPLAIGHGEGEMFLGSDAIALAPFTNRSPISKTATGRSCAATRSQIFDIDGKPRSSARASNRMRHIVHGRQGQSPAFHGEGNP